MLKNGTGKMKLCFDNFLKGGKHDTEKLKNTEIYTECTFGVAVKLHLVQLTLGISKCSVKLSKC